VQRGGAGGRARRARGQEGKRARGQERCRNALFIGLPGSKNSEACLVYRGLTDRSVALAFLGDKKTPLRQDWSGVSGFLCLKV